MTVIKETTSIKLDKNLKKEAKKIFAQLGITMGDAVNMFLAQAVFERGLPFEVKIPNEETLKAIEEVKDGEAEEISFENFQDEMKKCIVN